MTESLSGSRVDVDTIIFVNMSLASDRQRAVENEKRKLYGGALQYEQVVVPDGHRRGGVEPRFYDGYRAGLDSACSDIVITTLLPGRPPRVPAVLAVKRAPGKLFGGKWWMQGGAIHSYRLIADFLGERAEKECGVRYRLEGFIGVFRTCAEDRLGSTINLCYVGFVPYGDLARLVIADSDHTAVKVLSQDNLNRIPTEERYWYPMHVFRLALATMPSL